ncbi:MAG: bleomycin resistance protein [Algoriphagus aquaeductus]|uniref:bleomycin resistance protein n=1 Tax=Algoriphagus aquaeductus TaxID=475299 RepID=UPI00387A6FAB
MLTSIAPKLPMRDKSATKEFYHKLGFSEFGKSDFPGYLMIRKEGVELHFFEFAELNPQENYGQVYIRVSQIELVYQDFLDKGVAIHPNGPLQTKPWGQKEFSLLDPDHNLLTFGEGI